jgi:hypothetical protein
MNRLTANTKKLRKQQKLIDSYSNYLTKKQFLTELRTSYTIQLAAVSAGTIALLAWPTKAATLISPVLNQAIADTNKIYYVLAGIGVLLALLLTVLLYPQQLRRLLSPAEAAFRLLTKAGAVAAQAGWLWTTLAVSVLAAGALREPATAHWPELVGYGLGSLVVTFYNVLLEFALVNQYIEKYLPGRVKVAKSE